MAGQLDSILKNVAKQVVSQLGDSLDTEITYIRKTSPVYNPSTGALTTTDVSYTIDQIYAYRPDLLAFDLYGSPRLWWVFAQRNPDAIEDPIYDFAPGVTIQLPKLSNLKSDLGI
jgi:alpha-L-fucosidase